MEASGVRQLRQGLLAGVIATLTMDILSTLASRLGLIAPLPPNLIGRWFASVAQGHPLHADIAQSPRLSYEMALALLGHYLIGITLAYLFIWSTTQLSLPAQHPGVAVG